jgi:hypothetical protein
MGVWKIFTMFQRDYLPPRIAQIQYLSCATREAVVLVMGGEILDHARMNGHRVLY